MLSDEDEAHLVRLEGSVEQLMARIITKYGGSATQTDVAFAEENFAVAPVGDVTRRFSLRSIRGRINALAASPEGSPEKVPLLAAGGGVVGGDGSPVRSLASVLRGAAGAFSPVSAGEVPAETGNQGGDGGVRAEGGSVSVAQPPSSGGEPKASTDGSVGDERVRLSTSDKSLSIPDMLETAAAMLRTAVAGTSGKPSTPHATGVDQAGDREAVSAGQDQAAATPAPLPPAAETTGALPPRVPVPPTSRDAVVNLRHGERRLRRAGLVALAAASKPPDAVPVPLGLSGSPGLMVSPMSKAARKRTREDTVLLEKLMVTLVQNVRAREKILLALETFEKHASDPRRLFRGSSVARLREERERTVIVGHLQAAEKRLLRRLGQLQRDFGQDLLYKGVPYSEQMARDRVDIIYRVETDRLAREEARLRDSGAGTGFLGWAFGQETGGGGGGGHDHEASLLDVVVEGTRSVTPASTVVSPSAASSRPSTRSNSRMHSRPVSRAGRE